MSSKYIFSVNGESFGTATKALKRVKELQKTRVKIVTLRVNSEPLMLFELESEARRETEERAHNKRQGL